MTQFLPAYYQQTMTARLRKWLLSARTEPQILIMILI